MKEKSAIIPIRMHKGRPEVLLIHNHNSTKWIIPKGTIEAPLKPYISATKEAYEEAGVLGKPHPIIVGNYFRNNQLVPTYLLEVDVELKHYEEKSRKRKWATEEELPQYIQEKDLLKILIRCIRIHQESAYYFKYAIKTFCEERQVQYSKITKKKASLNFEVADGVTQRVFIYRSGSDVEFLVPSKMKFKGLDEIPDGMAARYLLENSENKLGFWSIEQFENELYFTRMYNIELRLLSCEYFFHIIASLATQCYFFDQEQMVITQPKNTEPIDAGKTNT